MRTRGLPVLAVLLVIAACGDTNTPNRGATKRFVARAVLADWAKRFAVAAPGASDARLPQLPSTERTELVDRLVTAVSTSRFLAKQRLEAAAALRAAGDPAIAALRTFVHSPDRTVGQLHRAFAVFAEAPPPALATLCFELLDSGDETQSVLAAQTLAQMHALHAIPRLLRRLKYELDQPPRLTLAVCRCLAQLGNPSCVPVLLPWLEQDARREDAGAVLVELCRLFGPAYVDQDGWAGLARKARAIHRRFARVGHIAFVKPKNARPSHAEQQRVQRELWRFLRELGNPPLRPVDEARYVARNMGSLAVPLLNDALESKSGRVRVHTLEILRDLGLPGKPTEANLAKLVHDPLCRPYALEALGAAHAKTALDTLAGLLIVGRDDPKTERSNEDLVAALKGMMHLREPRALPLLQRLATGYEETELRVWASAALLATSEAASAAARNYLRGLLESKRFHAPTLRELLDRFATK